MFPPPKINDMSSSSSIQSVASGSGLVVGGGASLPQLPSPCLAPCRSCAQAADSNTQNNNHGIISSLFYTREKRNVSRIDIYYY